MNINFKRLSVFGCALATAFALTACDDSSSNPKSDNDNPSSSSISNEKPSSSTDKDDNEEEDDDSGKGNNIIGNDDDEDSGNHGSKEPSSSASSGSNQHGTTSHSSSSTEKTVEENASLTYNTTIDENAQTLTIERPEGANMKCVISGSNVQWKSVPTGTDTQKMKYSFVGDTLILLNWSEEYKQYSEYAVMYVGGKAGNIYGTWEMSPCEYEVSTATTECYEEDFGYNYQIEISKNSITAKPIKHAVEIDYAKTSYRNSLVRYLDDGLNYYPSIYELFIDADEIETDFEMIKTVKQTATSEIFTIGETTVTVDVKQFDKSYNGRTATIEITTDENVMSCIGTYEEAYEVTKEYCKASNLDYFNIEDGTDNAGKSFSYAEYYEKENNREFSNCLMSMFNKYSLDNRVLLEKVSSNNKENHHRHKFPKFFK